MTPKEKESIRRSIAYGFIKGWIKFPWQFDFEKPLATVQIGDKARKAIEDKFKAK